MIGLLSFSGSAFGYKTLCHRCKSLVQQKKIGRVYTAYYKTKCIMKRLITRRYCCEGRCYKNSKNYKAKVYTVLKNHDADGLALCINCKRHHICNICGRKFCYPDCNDHAITKT